MDTIRVKPWGKGQGDHVTINAEDYDPAIHDAIDPVAGAYNGFLARKAPDIIADLETLTPDELADTLAAEMSGKNRAGVIKAIQDRMD